MQPVHRLVYPILKRHAPCLFSTNMDGLPQRNRQEKSTKHIFPSLTAAGPQARAGVGSARSMQWKDQSRALNTSVDRPCGLTGWAARGYGVVYGRVVGEECRGTFVWAQRPGQHASDDGGSSEEMSRARGQSCWRMYGEKSLKSGRAELGGSKSKFWVWMRSVVVVVKLVVSRRGHVYKLGRPGMPRCNTPL